MDAARLLLAAGADPRTRKRRGGLQVSGKTPADCARKAGFPDLVELLHPQPPASGDEVATVLDVWRHELAAAGFVLKASPTGAAAVSVPAAPAPSSPELQPASGLGAGGAAAAGTGLDDAAQGGVVSSE
ncbi:MAG: hypothetical protein EOO41_02760 [Methanobacteriota archaeon]|nr:MAG: hypothetical protein EOO41_02760 [Euryarchaeota archaeon]